MQHFQRLLSSSLLLMVLGSTIAQPGEWAAAGATTAGSGRAQAGLSDHFWALFANPAGLARLSRTTMGTHLEQRFALSELSAAQAGVAIPLAGNQALGFRGSWFGTEDFGEGRYGLSYAIAPLERVHLGTSLSWYQTVITGVGSGSSLYLDLGMQVVLSDQVTLGAFAVNVNRATLRNLGEGSPLPTLLQAGLAFAPSDQMTLLIDASQTIQSPTSVHAGFRYQPAEMLHLSFGVQTAPVQVSAGLGLEWEQLRLDLASQYQALLGFTPHLALTYALPSPNS